MKKQNCHCATETSITSFQIGPDPEKDSVCVETLLMQLAMAETVIKDMARYIDATEQNGGIRPDEVEQPDDWAVSGMRQNLSEVSHALKAGCWGYRMAHMH